MTTSPDPRKRSRGGLVKEITSLSNPIVKDIKALTQKKNRDQSGQFFAEGLKLIIDALDLGWTIRTLIYAKNNGDNPNIQSAAAKVFAQGGLILEVSEKVLVSITRRDNPQMVAGVIDQRYQDLTAAKVEPDDTWIALDRVRDPGNLGTIIRTADAAGAKGVILVDETTDPFSLETIRATMGSVFAVPIIRATGPELANWAKENHCQLVGTHLKGATDYRLIDYRSRPTVLLMGNEQSGLPDQLANACNALVKIPQAGMADSLNLAIATGIMVFEARRHLLGFGEDV